MLTRSDKADFFSLTLKKPDSSSCIRVISVSLRINVVRFCTRSKSRQWSPYESNSYVQVPTIALLRHIDSFVTQTKRYYVIVKAPTLINKPSHTAVAMPNTGDESESPNMPLAAVLVDTKAKKNKKKAKPITDQKIADVESHVNKSLKAHFLKIFWQKKYRDYLEERQKIQEKGLPGGTFFKDGTQRMAGVWGAQRLPQNRKVR